MAKSLRSKIPAIDYEDGLPKILEEIETDLETRRKILSSLRPLMKELLALSGISPEKADAILDRNR